MCAMRLVSGKENPVSALLASESRERAKRFVDIRVLSSDGAEDEIDVLRKLAKDYYEVCDENVKLKKKLYDVEGELKKLNSIREEDIKWLEILKKKIYSCSLNSDCFIQGTIFFFAVILSVIGFIYDGSFIGGFVLFLIGSLLSIQKGWGRNDHYNSMMYICSKFLFDNKVVDNNGGDCPLTMKERLGVVMVVALLTIFLSFITVDWSAIF